jgi:hypothetical protein
LRQCGQRDVQLGFRGDAMGHVGQFSMMSLPGLTRQSIFFAKLIFRR